MADHSYGITANQVVVDLDERVRLLNPFVSPLLVMLEKVQGRKHKPTEWELIGEKLIEMDEIAWRIRQIELEREAAERPGQARHAINARVTSVYT